MMNNRLIFILCALGLFSQVVFRDSGENKPEFTILLNTFRRDHNLFRIVDNYKRCENVKQIVVLWNDVERDWSEMKDTLGDSATILVPGDNRISNRFLVENLDTDAVFHADDDMLYTCDLIEEAFALWLDNQDTMVGFAPRLFKRHGHSMSYRWDGSYRNGKCTTCWITKGGFIHRRFMDLYRSDDAYSPIRDLVDRYTTGEDMLMSLIQLEHGSGVIPIEVKPDQFMNLKDKNKQVALNNRSGRKRGEVMHAIYRYMRSVNKKTLFDDSIIELNWLNKTKVRI